MCVYVCVWACASLTAAALSPGGALPSRQESFTLYKTEAGVSIFILAPEKTQR